MEKLHRKYAFAPADKAANNVIIIWKRHNVEVLKGELNSTSTYVPAQLTKDHPREDAGGLSREYVLRIPSVS